MDKNYIYKLDDLVETKKSHVCGNKIWRVIRTGADIKLECLGCKRVILLAKNELDKKIKKILEK